MDRIETMRALVAVVREGSFTKAAERLQMSPQLVSKYVGKLEEQLGARLLQRTTRSLHVTEAGARYAQRAELLLDELADMDQQLGNFQQEAKGELRISAPVSFAAKHMGPLLSDFRQTHPEVTVDLQLNDRKVDIVDEGFDIALRIGRLRDSSLIAKPIAPIKLVLCASPAYLEKQGTPAQPKDLADHHFLRYSYLDAQAIPLNQHLQQARHSLVCNNGDLLTQAAIAGAGIALQPTFIAGDAIKRGELVALLTEHTPPPFNLYAVYSHRTHLASKVRAFIEFIDGYFGDPPYWDGF
ncbi:LysR family transcriptional regulator [Teredinibacter turnerae]|uniref:LysR family transcriptional regulator n=1 Tax=Teredinibacter turnerae TaxID=2426 RepID=UPI0003697B22|nr:LysR family transcriptional regulator [Teredinibacter turnerae]